MLHGLLSFRGNKLCYLCKQYEEKLDHLLFHCPFLTQSRELVKGWLRLMGCQAFNRQTIIEMTGIQSGIENFAISTYKDVIWKNRNIAKLRPVSKNTIYNVLERTVSFYIRYIFKLWRSYLTLWMFVPPYQGYDSQCCNFKNMCKFKTNTSGAKSRAMRSCMSWTCYQ